MQLLKSKQVLLWWLQVFGVFGPEGGGKPRVVGLYVSSSCWGSWISLCWLVVFLGLEVR